MSSTRWIVSVVLAIVLAAAIATPASGVIKDVGVVSSTVLNAPVNQTLYLRDIHATVGSTTYNTVNTTQGAAIATATTWIGQTGYRLFADSLSHSIFVSPPVPSGYTWTLTGNWTYVAYVSTSSTAAVGYMLARVFRIYTNGSADLIYVTSNTSADALSATAYVTQNWTAPIPGAVLKAGERFGVEFVVRVTTISASGTATLGFNGTGGTTSPNSYVSVTYNQDAVVPAAYVKQAHYRIGNDEPLTAMTWRGYIDQTAPHVRRDVNYRVRFQVYNDGSQSDNWSPQLEWSATSGSGYQSVPTTSGSAPFFINDTPDFANAATISTANFYLGAGNGTAVTGIAYDTVNPPASPISLAAASYTEVEFNIQANSNATYNGTYYFRLTSAGTALDAYDVNEAVLRIQLSPSASDPHNTYLATTDKCAICHRSHTGKTLYLRRTTSSEQALCFSCHDSTGATTNIQAQFSENITGAPVASNNKQHPVALTEFVHRASENTSSNFSGANRHVECEDCHRPHSRFAGLHDDGNNAASLMIDTSSGVRVTNTANWTAPTFTFVQSIAYEYELCLKCHSSWAYGSSPPNTPSGFWNSSGTIISANETDQSKEFNTLNRSHHAVEGPGKNQPPVWANPNWPYNGKGLSNNFVSPWTATSTVQCNDCHARDVSSEPEGPHGSTKRWALRQNETGVGTAAVFCYNCHDRTVYGDNGDSAYDNVNYKHAWSRFPHRWFIQQFSGHTTPVTSLNRWGIWCMSCHAGDVLGGTHGTDRGVGTSGISPVGNRFLNGTAVIGWTSGNTTRNSGMFYGKTAVDAVNLCNTTHGSGRQWTANYNY